MNPQMYLFPESQNSWFFLPSEITADLAHFTLYSHLYIVWALPIILYAFIPT